MRFGFSDQSLVRGRIHWGARCL